MHVTGDPEGLVATVIPLLCIVEEYTSKYNRLFRTEACSAALRLRGQFVKWTSFVKGTQCSLLIY
jgi:hypothetical protein